MRGSLADKERLGHILDAINSIESFTKDVSVDGFMQNYMLQLAVIKLLENIGEASNKITNELRSELNDIDWSVMIRSRNVLVHDYFKINLKVIWLTIQNDLPGLKERIENLYTSRFPES